MVAAVAVAVGRNDKFLAPAKTVTVCSQLRFGQSCGFHSISARASLNRIAVMGLLD
jgi:hypothetical protein